MSNQSFRTDSSGSKNLNSHRLEFVRVSLHPQKISPKKTWYSEMGIMHEFSLENRESSCHSIPLATSTFTLEYCILEKIYHDISLHLYTNKHQQ